MFAFGEKHSDFEIPVFNEREIRAAAGIIFLFAFVAFMNGWLTGNNGPTKIMVSAFFVDFFIRVFVNPKYAPSMIIGRWIVKNQTPKYVGAAPKRWAWALGFMLAGIMFYLVVLNGMGGPIIIAICGVCLGLFFSESAFGVCVGCKVYDIFHKKNTTHGPEESCDLSKIKNDIRKMNYMYVGILFVSLVGVVWGISGW
jgi:hypothetical protein